MENSKIKRKLFKLKPGQVNYTNIRYAPVINCVLKHKDKFLVVWRSKKLNFYPGYWNGISGFLDDQKGLEEKVIREIKEETGILKSQIRSIELGQIFHQEEPEYKKTWIVHPVLVEVNTDKVKLDWEAENYKWARAEEIKKLKLMPGFDKVLKRIKL
jgi:NADH pyrophosphatase NudC (nudix superfamily)